MSVCTLTSSVDGGEGEVGQEKQPESHEPGSKARGPGEGVAVVGKAEGLSNFTRSFPGQQNSWHFPCTE